MKTLLTSLLMIVLINSGFAQSNKSLQSVAVTDVSAVTTFGYLATYTVTFKNTSAKTIDQISWTVYYYDNSGKLIKSEKESFNSDSFVDPIASGFEKTLARAPGVKGASKVQVVINSAHSADGTTFKS